MNELPKKMTTEILVYCKAGGRAATASQMIADARYERIYNVKGGIDPSVIASYPFVIDPNSWANNYPNLTKV